MASGSEGEAPDGAGPSEQATWSERRRAAGKAAPEPWPLVKLADSRVNLCKIVTSQEHKWVSLFDIKSFFG
jgi:hypothetical protein